jgi:hypothetical protein
MLVKLVQQVVFRALFAFLVLIGLLLFIRVPAFILLLLWSALYFLAFRVRIKRFLLLLMLLSLGVRIFYALLVQTPPQSDFALLYDASVMFSKGDYSFQNMTYFREWAYQTGFVVYQGTLLRIFGIENGVLVLKLFNCLWNAGINALIYLIARNHVSEEIARFTALLYTFFVFPVAFVSVLTNQHIASFFILLGLFILTDKRHLRLKSLSRSLTAALSMALGNIMRPEGLIIIGSVLVYFVCHFFSIRGKHHYRAVLGKAAVFIAVYFIVNTLAYQIIVDTGINREGLKNNTTLWKFVLGLNHQSGGVYSNDDVSLVYGKEMPQWKKIMLEQDLIKERMGKGIAAFAGLFINKLQHLWCDDALFWSYGHISGSKELSILGFNIPFRHVDNALQDLQAMMSYAILAAGIVGAFTQKGRNNAALLLYSTILVASFLVYLFIEVQSRYAYSQQVFLFILASPGLEWLYGRLKGTALKQQ